MALGGGGGGGGSSRAIEAGRAFVRLGAKDDLTSHLKRIIAGFSKFGKAALAATGVGGLLAGALGGLGFKETVDDLAKMNDVAKAFGISGRAASGLFGALGAAGGEFKENLEGIIQFSGTFEKALNGIGQGAELFQGLNVTAKELADLPIDEKFYRVLGAIREMPQGLQESKLALLGGTDSMKQWQKLLVMSNEEFRELARSQEIGNQELEDAARASAEMNKAGQQLNRVWQQLVIMVAPMVADLAKSFADGLKPFVEWLKGRTFADMWEESVASVLLGWEEIKQAGREALYDTANNWEEWLDDAIQQAKEEWENFWAPFVVGAAAATATVGNFFKKMFDNAAEKVRNLALATAQALTNPQEALRILGAAGADAFSPDAGIQAWKDVAADLDRMIADATDGKTMRDRANDWLDEFDPIKGQDKVDAARDNLEAVRARIEARRLARMGEDKLPQPAAKAAAEALMKSLGTFGGQGNFLGRSLGVQAAETAKEQLAEQKKANEHLEKIANAGPLVFK